jgi:hypothetical protein
LEIKVEKKGLKKNTKEGKWNNNRMEYKKIER